MYSSILPFVNKHGICTNTFPDYYHGVGTIVDPDKDVVVIEDLRPKGFRITDAKVFLDYRHLKLAIEKLGMFHALSYSAKKEKPEMFHKLVGNLKESSWLDESSMINDVINQCFHRALDPLIAAGRHADVLRRLLSRVDDSVIKFLRELVTPEEPMAVLCHGDFCRNNILFKYDQRTPTDVRFFDVATARYSSPVVDIAFFLFMNSTKEMRAAHWDDLLAAYHGAVSAAVPGIQVPSLQQIKDELRLKAVYGFVHCSFFLPMMLYENDLTNLENSQEEEVGQAHILLGGEEGTKLLMDMAEELVERGCLTLEHPFLKQA